MDSKLFPLKVPGGWAVVKNSFADVEPVVQGGRIINDEFFSEDLLSVEALKFDGDRWVTDEVGYVFDMGWYPEASPSGCYRFTLLHGGWDNIVLTRESSDRNQIRRLLEQCFELLAQGTPVDLVAERLNAVDLAAA